MPADERSDVVKVLVWNSRTDKEDGFWAEFEGEEVSSYEEGEKVYTLYKCTAYDFEAYRVHVYDATHPGKPRYELHPYHHTDPHKSGNYATPYSRAGLAATYPRFLKDVVNFPTHNIDADLPPS